MLFIRAASSTVVRMAGFLVGLVGLRGYRDHTHLIGGFPRLASQSGSGWGAAVIILLPCLFWRLRHALLPVLIHWFMLGSVGLRVLRNRWHWHVSSIGDEIWLIIAHEPEVHYLIALGCSVDWFEKWSKLLVVPLFFRYIGWNIPDRIAFFYKSIYFKFNQFTNRLKAYLMDTTLKQQKHTTWSKMI